MQVVVTIALVVLLSFVSVAKLVWNIRHWAESDKIIRDAKLTGRVFRARCIQVIGDIDDEHVGLYEYYVDGVSYKIAVDNCSEDSLDVYWVDGHPEKAVTELDVGMTGIKVLPLIVWQVFYIFVESIVVYGIVGLVCQYFAQ